MTFVYQRYHTSISHSSQMKKIFPTCLNTLTFVIRTHTYLCKKKKTRDRPTLHNLYRLIVSVHNPSSSWSWLVGGWFVMYLFDSVFDRRQIFTLYSHHRTFETAALEKNCLHIFHRNTVFILNEYTVAIECSVCHVSTCKRTWKMLLLQSEPSAKQLWQWGSEMNESKIKYCFPRHSNMYTLWTE